MRIKCEQTVAKNWAICYYVNSSLETLPIHPRGERYGKWKMKMWFEHMNTM